MLFKTMAKFLEKKLGALRDEINGNVDLKLKEHKEHLMNELLEKLEQLNGKLIKIESDFNSFDTKLNQIRRVGTGIGEEFTTLKARLGTAVRGLLENPQKITTSSKDNN